MEMLGRGTPASRIPASCKPVRAFERVKQRPISMKSSLSWGRARGFTLIELLVVIAIIAVLSSLLLPAISKAKKQAKAAGCASNLHQLGLAMDLYADDSSGFLPGTAHTSLSNSWVFGLAAYLGNVDRLRICPADAKGRERLAQRGTSYVLNEYTSLAALDPFGEPDPQQPSWNRLQDLRRPADTFVVFEISNVAGAGTGQDHTHSRNWLNGWSSVTNDIQPDRHGSAANYLFADWHVQRIVAEPLRRRIQTGDNFALPPE